jgi:secondary thiamine-phosphate synthase enzyme
MHKNLSIRSTTRCQFIEITGVIRQAVQEARLTSGLCVVYCPHTTAGITVQENADPDVVHDLLLWFNRYIPQDLPGFRHAEGNSDSHIKSALVGNSATLLVTKGELVLGTWQGVYFCEFDGPRQRTILVQTIGNMR